MSKKILVTGTAGFIGFHLAKKLLASSHWVVGVDNMNDYYDINLKIERNKILEQEDYYVFYKVELENKSRLNQIFSEHKPEFVIHLAAQAGVRDSLTRPFRYLNSNLVGFLNVIECCKNHEIKHLVYASTSSVYGTNEQTPFQENHKTDHPVSLYAATKKSNELIAHSYAANFELPVTGLRFFTVYGPWGRPDMSLFLFTKAILADEPINVFNYGKMRRDFTYVDDIVESVALLIPKIPQKNPNWDYLTPDSSTSFACYAIYNIGNNNCVEIMDFIRCIEKELKKKAKINYMPMQLGDVPATYADVDRLFEKIGFRPKTPVATGIKHFVSWYRSYYSV